MRTTDLRDNHTSNLLYRNNICTLHTALFPGCMPVTLLRLSFAAHARAKKILHAGAGKCNSQVCKEKII